VSAGPEIDGPNRPGTEASPTAPTEGHFESGGPGRGHLAVVGLGPGRAEWRTPEATDLLAGATDLVGYSTYLDMVEDRPAGQRRHPSDNRQEAERAAHALDMAAEGRRVAIVSSGDPGVFAMAAAVMEQLDRPDGPARWASVEVTVAPGITAAQAAAARAGAPLGHDFATISLSDNLKPWSVIETRLTAAAAADFVLALYNPASRHRPWQIERALEIIRDKRGPDTPVVAARDVGRPGEAIRVLNLSGLEPSEIDMRTVLLVGSSQTRVVRRATGTTRVYTPRRYPPPTDVDATED
jgi:precorrin-2 C20-methyltransferase/precorrin-3B C17-methyltransferase